MKFQQTALNIAMLLALGVGVTACGGGSSGGDTGTGGTGGTGDNGDTTPATQTLTIEVQAEDTQGKGLTNETACIDINANDACDSNEPSTPVSYGSGYLKVDVAGEIAQKVYTQDELTNAKVVVKHGNKVYKRVLEGALKNYDGKKVEINALSTMVTDYSESSGKTFDESATVIANKIGTTSDSLKGAIKKETPLSAFAYSLEKSDVKITPDSLNNSSKFDNAIKHIEDGMNNAGMDEDQIADYFESNSSFEGITEEQKQNTPPTVDGISAEAVGCLGGKFAAVNPYDADNDKLSYCWDFGDGSDKTCGANAEVTHTFTSGQAKTVKLTVKDAVSSVNAEVSFTPDNSVCVGQVDVDFSADVASSANGLVQFKASVSGDVDHFEWDFGDGVKDSSSLELSHVYKVTSSKQDYNVVLTVYDSYNKPHVSNHTVTIIPQVNNAPVVSGSATLLGKDLTFKSTSTDADGDNLTCVWDFGDGSTSSSCNGTHTYKKDGNYPVSLKVSDGKDTVSKVINTVTVVTDPSNTVPVAAGTAELSGSTLTFKSTSTDADGDNLSCIWDFGDGSTSDACSGTYTYKQGGKFSVTLKVSDGKESNTKVINEVSIPVVTPNTAPVVSGTAVISKNTLTFNSTSTDADGDSLTYKWDFGDNSKGSDQKSGTYTYTASGTFSVKLTVSDGKAESTKVISSVSPCGDNCVTGPNNPPTADFHYSITGLEGLLKGQATDADKDKLTYSWSGDGAIFSAPNAKNTNVTFKDGGSKTITFTVSDGKDTTSKSYTFSLKNVDVVKPTARGIYYKGTDADGIYLWDDNKNTPAGAWPGATMTPASQAGWMFYDTSAISGDKINVIFLKDGKKVTLDLTNAPVAGCYADSGWIEFDKCNLSESEPETVEGGCEIGGGDVEGPIGGDIPWNQLDYASYTSTATGINVESAPYVVASLAPGAYHEDQTVTLNLEDADRAATDGTIYYTLDNSVPSESSKVYTGPITLADTSTDGLGTAYRLRALVVGENGVKQEQHFFWFIKNDTTVAPATDFRDETIYFVVTARFFDGDESNNYFCRDRFDPTDPSWRGDFKGLIEKLDYIKDMGFTAIWVTPPVENRSGLDYHGYHAYDWFQPDLRLESPGATYFDFIKAAHKKGIKVIQDVVLNHSSNYGIRGQAWIEKIPTKYYIEQGKQKGWVDMGPYQGHIGDYVSEGKCDNDNPVAPAWHRAVCAGDPEANATFSVKFKNGTASVTGSATPKGDAEYYWSPAVAGYLPEKWYHVGYTNNWESVEEVQQRSMAGDCVDLKTESDNVRNYMDAAMSMYIDMGIDAVRIDTLKHMPREDVIAMVSTWQKKKPGMFVYGEALIKGFGDNTPDQLLPWFYTRTGSGKTGDSGVSVLDFSLMSTFRDNVTKGSVGGLASVFERFDGDYADATKLVTFFQNHDLTPDNTWSGSGAQHCCTDRVNSALAYNVLWTVRGIPVMYAGDETGVRVGLPPDLTSANDLVKETGRIYIGDTLVPGTDPIQAHVKDLNAIRKTSKALQRGKLVVLNGEPFVFERQYEGERAIVAIPGTGGAAVTVSGATDGSYTDVVTGAKFTVSGGSVSLGDIPGGSMRVLVKDYTGGKVVTGSQFLK